ncbi:MAG: hypothetical protein AAF610_08135 [Pseudomonadota bacterium]
MVAHASAWCAVLAAALALATISTSAAPAAQTGETVQIDFEPQPAARLRDRALLEVSGMATSRRSADVLWVHNDSGSRAVVYAIDAHGHTRGRVQVKGATARDWEDMASFVYEGRPMLLVADIGDNKARRATVWLHVFEEPALSGEAADLDLAADLAWSVPLLFPDGPADCESVAVDIERSRVLLLTKRENPPRLYEVPLKPDGALPARGAVQSARLISEVGGIPRPTAEDLLADPVFGAYASQPTAMDLAGRELVVLTYTRAYRFVAKDGESWRTALQRPPEPIALPRLKQAEALAFDANGRDLFVTSERRSAPLIRLARRHRVGGQP